jgi:phosphonoacetaldehyde hydrolase
MNNKITAIIFDWAGTIIDQGSCGPINAFIDIFAAKNIKITGEQVRGPMGMNKIAHIKNLTELPEIQHQWVKKHGQPPLDKDIQELFGLFETALERNLLQHSKLIPDAAKTIEGCRERNIKIGSTTGYSRSQMNIIIPEAKKQGLFVDSVVCASDVPEGRPSPWMIFEAAKQLKIYPPSTWVKVDDTLVGIEEGKNAGAWTIGVTKTGNLVGLGDSELITTTPDELKNRISNAEKLLHHIGTDFIISSVADIMPVLKEIEERMKYGEHPKRLSPIN